MRDRNSKESSVGSEASKVTEEMWSTCVLAARENHHEILEQLLDENPSVYKYEDKNGNNILHKITMSDEKIEIDSFDNVAVGILAYTRKNSLDTTKMLDEVFKSQNNRGDSPLHVAVATKNPERLTWLIEGYSSILKDGLKLEQSFVNNKVKALVNQTNKNGETVLDYAYMVSDNASIKYLKEIGGQCNAQHSKVGVASKILASKQPLNEENLMQHVKEFKAITKPKNVDVSDANPSASYVARTSNPKKNSGCSIM